MINSYFNDIVLLLLYVAAPGVGHHGRCRMMAAAMVGLFIYH